MPVRKRKKKNREGEEALLGAAFAGLVSGKKGDVLISTLVEAATRGAIDTQNEAKENEVPYVVEESGVLYKICPDGKKKRMRAIRNTRYKISRPKFDLE